MVGGKASGLFASSTEEDDDWPQDDAEDIRDAKAVSVPSEAAVPIALDAARQKLMERTVDVEKRLQAFAAQAKTKPHEEPLLATTYQDIA